MKLILIAIICLLAVPAAGHEQWTEEYYLGPAPNYGWNPKPIPHNHAAELQEYLLLEQFCLTAELHPQDIKRRAAFLEKLGLECP